MADNFDDELVESESSLQNLSEEELLQSKQNYENNNCNNDCGLLEGDLLSCSSCNLPYHLQCLLENDNELNCLKCYNNLYNNNPNNSQSELLENSNNLNELEQPTQEEDNVPSNKLEGELENKSELGNKLELEELEKSPIKIIEEKKKKKPTTEGSNFQTKINVGFNHQVPFTPAFFLDYSYSNNNYNYSNTLNNNSNNNQQQQKQEWARLMYSPYQMEKIRRRKLKEGLVDTVIKNEFELAEFIQMCAKSWKNNPGWHPFSPEFAYKILHFADYDPNKALKFMNDPSFNFSCVCDPPTRRYDNKWKPKDRRGQVPTNPYPPPVTLRGYLLRRHNLNK